MSGSVRVWRLLTVLVLGCCAVFVEDLAGQEADPGSPTILGQPAGWSMESEAPAMATIVEGSTLYLDPIPSSPILAMLPEGQLPIIESHGSWVKVHYGDQFGWVDLETPRRPADAAITRAAEPEAFQLPDAEWYRKTWGTYELFSLVYDQRLLNALALAAKGHAELYADRFGLSPRQAISGSVVILANQEAFRTFLRHRDEDVRVTANGYFLSPEMVFLYPGRSSKRQLSATLIHELTHLLNWQILRELGRTDTPLPPWLEEGMADDLALSLQGRNGELTAEPLGPGNLHYGPRLGALLHRLVSDMAAGGSGYAPSLRQLMTMDKGAFMAAERERHYLMSSLWVRYLLSGAGDEIAGRFRGYLATMVRGGSSYPDELASQLGRDLNALENGFRVWLTQQRALFGI